MRSASLAFGLLLTACPTIVPAQTEDPAASAATPDLLTSPNGTRIAATADEWQAHRTVLLDLLAKEMFGEMPAERFGVAATQIEVDPEALEGAATRSQWSVELSRGERRLTIDLLVYVPNRRNEPAPVFLGLNFKGNHTVWTDEEIRVPTTWMADDAKFGVEANRASATARGRRAARWPVDRIVARGYALATAYYGDIDPDYDDDFQNGLHALLGDDESRKSLGTIGAWAFGLSHLLDALGSVGGIDRDRVAVFGHSRLGKTALWAGATEPRFWFAISNNSGCGGAALSRRRHGETLERIQRVFPHWFTARFRRYADREDELPFDQHHLVALMAPRPVYVASASLDDWADPLGEFLATRAAGPAWELHGLDALGDSSFPDEPDTALGEGHVGYHLRAGKHDVTAWDWDRYLDFADRHLDR
jgi:hypothetical protein